MFVQAYGAPLYHSVMYIPVAIVYDPLYIRHNFINITTDSSQDIGRENL